MRLNSPSVDRVNGDCPLKRNWRVLSIVQRWSTIRRLVRFLSANRSMLSDLGIFTPERLWDPQMGATSS